MEVVLGRMSLPVELGQEIEVSTRLLINVPCVREFDINFCPIRRVLRTVYAFFECCEKNTGDSDRNRTHDLLLTSANVLTIRPPSLPMVPMTGRFESLCTEHAAGTVIVMNNVPCVRESYIKFGVVIYLFFWFNVCVINELFRN